MPFQDEHIDAAIRSDILSKIRVNRGLYGPFKMSWSGKNAFR